MACSNYEPGSLSVTLPIITNIFYVLFLVKAKIEAHAMGETTSEKKSWFQQELIPVFKHKKSTASTTIRFCVPLNKKK